jgi:exodeoxyribonuclease V alpha subunit
MKKQLAEPQLADIDRHFGRFIGQFGGDKSLAELVATHLSRSVREGHICLYLDEINEPGLDLSNRSDVIAKLKQSPAFGTPNEKTPIVIDRGQRLYLRRYWVYQDQLARAILRRARQNRASKGRSGTQDAAIEAALNNQFTVISGGPGTGKTTTVLTILHRMLASPEGAAMRVALAAPTGKAAARLQELLRNTQDRPDIPDRVKQLVPQTASTIHRLLGPRPDSIYFQYDASNPLPLDVLVVDEASMVPMPLMAKLFDALPEKARVILLGDRDQLASVDPGAVLADIVEAASPKQSPLHGAISILSKNYRFGNSNAIFKLATAVRSGDADGAADILAQDNLVELGKSDVPGPAILGARLEAAVVDRYQIWVSEKDPTAALAALPEFRVLCALREGPFGVGQLNSVIEQALHRRGLISDPSHNYAGKPILITQNDYQARLYNGDVGIFLADPAEADSDRLWAWFAGQDKELRRLSPARLPEYEPAYAMTVHKAQGSEFDRVLLILPDRDSPVLSRELVYTGITRASKRVDIWFNPDVFRAAVRRQAIRRSGLREALTPNNSPELFDLP